MEIRLALLKLKEIVGMESQLIDVLLCMPVEDLTMKKQLCIE